MDRLTTKFYLAHLYFFLAGTQLLDWTKHNHVTAGIEQLILVELRCRRH